jgi:hypothetical protein
LGSTEDWALTGLTVAILVPTLGMVGDQKKNALARRVTWQRNVSECTHLRLEIKLKTQTGNSRLLLISESALKVSGSFSSVFRLHPCDVCSATDIEESRNRQSPSTLSWETVIKEPPPAARIFNKPAMATMETMSMSSESKRRRDCNNKVSRLVGSELKCNYSQAPHLERKSFLEFCKKKGSPSSHDHVPYAISHRPSLKDFPALFFPLWIFEIPFRFYYTHSSRIMHAYHPSGLRFVLTCVGNILAKAAALRINLNLDGAPIASKSHTHPAHSQTSRLLTSSLSLGLPVPRPTQCVWGA